MFVVVAGETKTLVVLEVRAWRDQTLAARQQFRHEGREGELVDVMHLSQIQPLFSMTGDPVELVLQPSILLTLMGVLYELESLSYANLKARKDSFLSRPRRSGVASDGGADPAMNSLNSYSSRLSGGGFAGVHAVQSLSRRQGRDSPMAGEVDWKAKAEELERLLILANGALDAKESELAKHKTRDRESLLERSGSSSDPPASMFGVDADITLC